MKISTKDWKNYISKLSKLSNTAANKMEEYVRKNGFADTDALTEYAYALVTKYGEGSAELACQMYDAIAEMQGVNIESAVPADTASYAETSKAINGSLLQSETGQKLNQVVGRLVKQAGADTTLKNAKRDGAYFAWVPVGDTCPYCLMLGAIGWQRAGKTTLNGNHAKHIHSNCDCQYVVDFKGDMKVSGYDNIQEQKKILEAAGIDTSDLTETGIQSEFDDLLRVNGRKSTKGERNVINILRRKNYAENKDIINAQKREAYAKRKDKGIVDENLLRIPQIPASTITQKVRNGEYSLKPSIQQFNKHVEGTKEYQQYMESRIKEGLNAQSKLSVSRDEVAKIIEKYSGTGIIKVRKDGTPLNIEQITVDKVIGSYMQHGEWVETKKAAIHYSRRGTHVVPIKGNNYD